MAAQSHVAVTESAFRRLLELLALTLNLVETLADAELAGVALSEPDRVVRLQSAVHGARAEAAAVAEQAIVCRLADTRDWCPSAIVH